jgi:NTP pyrophosphatase (non-canonical NTP hydrolase)
MDFLSAQKEVDVWISQFKIKYFSPHEIITQLSEELGELSESILKNDSEGVAEELGDVVFALICMANSQNVILKKVYDFGSLSVDSFLYLSFTQGKLAKEISHLYGPKKKKKSEEESSVGDKLSDCCVAVSYFANKHNVDLSSSFSSHMNKLYGRDNNRWEKC